MCYKIHVKQRDNMVSYYSSETCYDQTIKKYYLELGEWMLNLEWESTYLFQMNIQLSGTDFNYAEEKSEHSEKRTYFRQDLIVASPSNSRNIYQ